MLKTQRLNTLKTKANNLDKKIPGATSLIIMNQYTDKQNVQNKPQMLILT